MPKTFPFGPALRERIVTNLAEFERTSVEDTSLRQAGVVIVIVRNLADEGAAVLLTKRPANLRRHAGQFGWQLGRRYRSPSATDQHYGRAEQHYCGTEDDVDRRHAGTLSVLSARQAPTVRQ